MDIGLTSTGLQVPRSADWLEYIQDQYESRTGLTVEWERDQVVGVFAAICADAFGELGELLQAIYDARIRANATGKQLSDLGTLIGVERNPATYSRATVTCTGVAGTVIVQGSIVEGGGDDDKSRWATTADVTIPGGGSVAVVVQAKDAGAVSAIAAQIDKIVTPIDGWTSVTNAAAAETGDAEEEDAAFRPRQQASLRVAGSASAESIRAKLAALDFITAAIVIENEDSAPAIVDGILLAANTIAAIVLPSVLTTAQQQDVVRVIFENLTAGVSTHGAETGTVFRLDGTSKTIRYDFASETATTVAYVIVMESGWTLADVDDDLEALVEAYFSSLAVGQDVTLLALYGLASQILDTSTGRPKIRSVTSLLIDGVALNKTVAATAYATLTSVAVAT